MAAPLRCVLNTRTTLFRAISPVVKSADSCRYASSLFINGYHRQSILSKQTTDISLCQVRHGSFMNSITADNLWESVVGVSNAGKKRGRGKRVGRKKSTDLNRGQMLGSGKANMVWPGLNAPVLKGREVVQRKQLPPDPDREADLAKLRDQLGKIRYARMSPLLRGWSGNRFPGQSVGKPDPINDYNFEGFDTRVLEFKLVTNMTGNLGRKQRFTAFVVVGNQNGLGGVAAGRATTGRAAVRIAQKRAAQRLMYIPRFDEHTVYHNMFTQFHATKIFIHKKEKGYGLKCHRCIKTICEVIGIKDIHCKVEGSTKNMRSVTHGFLQALLDQETHQELAEKTKLHVVEFKKERGNIPVVIASPTEGKASNTRIVDEVEDLESDFERLYYGGKVELKRPPKKPFFQKFKSTRIKYAEVHKRRNQFEAQINRMAGTA